MTEHLHQDLDRRDLASISAPMSAPSDRSGSSDEMSLRDQARVHDLENLRKGRRWQHLPHSELLRLGDWKDLQPEPAAARSTRRQPAAPGTRHPGHGGTMPSAGGAAAQPATTAIPAQRLAFLKMLGLSVGRIEVSFNDGEGIQIAGTAWLIGDDLAVTSRHVVLNPGSGFCAGVGKKPPMSTTVYGDPLEVVVNFGPAKVRVKEIEWVETLENDMASPDLAFLRLEHGVAMACPLALGPACEGQSIAVIQYPVFSDPASGDPPLAEPGQEHLTAGRVVAFDSGKWSLDHTASTYGGSSGSPVIDWQALQVVGMHCGANMGLTNRAVLASAIAERLDQLRLDQA